MAARKAWTHCAAAVALCALGACGDDSGTKGIAPITDALGGDTQAADTTPGDDTAAVEDTGAPLPDTASPAPNVLSYHHGMVGAGGQACVTQCVWDAFAGQELELAVVYRDAKGQPLVDRSVRFSSDAPDSLARLSALSVFTDDSGEARVTLRTFDVPGTVTVTADVSADPGAGSLAFVVTLELPPSPVLLASHEYVGQRGVADVSLRLFRQAGGHPGCAAVHPDAGGIQPAPTLVTGPYGVGQQAALFELPDLEADGEQRWTLQFIGPSDTPAPLAVGCEEGVVVRAGDTATALIYVLDLPKRFRGSFRATTRTDLVSGATGTLGAIVGGVVQLFTQPGVAVINFACTNPSGALGTVCGFLRDSNGNLTILGGVVADAANASFLAVMRSFLGDDVVVTGQVISNILRDLRLMADQVLDDEPSVSQSGFEGARFPWGAATEEWTHVRFRWEFDPDCKNHPDPLECGWTQIPLEEVYGFRPHATLSAGVDHSERLHVDEHVVPGMSYGPLVNAIIERRVLPLVFGDGSNGLPPVDTWEKLAGVLLGDEYCLYYDDCCEYFAYRVEDDVPFWVPVITACEMAIAAVGSFVRGRLLSLDGEMRVGTPPGSPCRAIDATGDRWTDGYGSQATPCLWDLWFPTSDGAFEPDADWRSIRQ